MSKEIYLVTGAAGNLGNSVVENLLNQGKHVRGFVLKGDPAAKRLPEGTEICEGDVTDVDSIERLFAVGPNQDVYVVHCAAIVTVNKDFNQKVYDVNVQGTKNIVDACVKHDVKKLVYVSSIGAIPEQPHGTPITEINHYDPDKVVGYYGKTKAMASQIVMDAVKDYDLDASVVFPTGICGPNDYAFGPVASFIIEYCEGKMSAGIEGSFNAVDARDLADAIIACTTKGRKGEGYILSNERVTMKQMFRLLSRVTGTEEVTRILPAGIGKLIGRVSDISGRITGKPQKMTSFAVYSLTRNNVFDCSKAEEELGFKTRPFEVSIVDTIEWLEKENRIGTQNEAA